jgi:RsiW-degrading membrane proteinase PrsW (M82 family)
MLYQELIDAAISLAPVAIFLVVLLQCDSYKLVSLKETSATLGAGVVLCGVSYLVNAGLLALTDWGFTTYSHFVAPFTEEAAKGAMIVWLITRNRIGFLIDAAIMGFAIGTGFAAVENLYYLHVFPDPNVGTLVVRGFGTALMHGGATALFGIVSQSLVDRDRFQWTDFLPGYGAAVALHALYNFLSFEPLIGALGVLLALPAVLFFIFTKSEHQVQSWLLQDYESHERLLEDIKSGAFSNTEAGRFIAVMAAKLGPTVAADMFAFIRVHTELALRADQVDLARATEQPVPITDTDRSNFARLHELERRIGRTAMMALWPHLHFTRKQLWELNEFEQEVRAAD